MPDSIHFIVYVNNAPEAARFYADLLESEPSLETSGYVPFDLGGGAGLSLWSGRIDGLNKVSGARRWSVFFDG